MRRMEREAMETNISMLPEGCISVILSLASPWDACRSSAVSPVFKSAVDSDALWYRFLPSDYQDILARSVSPVVYTTRKQLYFLLSDSPILLDGGKLSFMLDKRSGKKCYMLPSKELSIAWMNDARHWNWPSIRESRFSEVAQLIDVCWLEIRGHIRSRMISPVTRYVAYLVYRISRRRNYGLACLANTLVRFIGDGEESETSVVFLKEPVARRIPWGSTYWLPRRREDGWMEIELGSFFNGWGDDDGEVMMELMEIELGHSKCGLILEGIEVRPKEKGVQKLLGAEMRSAAEMRKEKDASEVVTDEAKKYKANADKYKDELGKVKKDNNLKEKELTKSTESLQKAEKDLEALKTQVQNLQVELKKYQDLEAQARVDRDQAMKDKQALVDERVAELEKTFEKGYNDAVIAATAEMRKLKDIIYQAGFELGLEKAQIPIGHELNRLKVTCPNSVFRATVETEDGTEVLASTRYDAEQIEGQGQ